MFCYTSLLGKAKRSWPPPFRFLDFLLPFLSVLLVHKVPKPETRPNWREQSRTESEKDLNASSPSGDHWQRPFIFPLCAMGNFWRERGIGEGSPVAGSPALDRLCVRGSVLSPSSSATVCVGSSLGSALPCAAGWRRGALDGPWPPLRTTERSACSTSSLFHVTKYEEKEGPVGEGPHTHRPFIDEERKGCVWGHAAPQEPGKDFPRPPRPLSVSSPSPSQSKWLCRSGDLQTEPGAQNSASGRPCSWDALHLLAGSRPSPARFLMRRRIGLWPLRSHYKVPCFS